MAYSKAVVWADFAVTSGGTVSPTITDSLTTMNVILNGTLAIVGLTLTLPVTNTQDGQIIKVSTNVAITGLVVNAETGGFIQGLLTSLLGGGDGIYQFRKSNNTWYKFSG